MAWITKQFRSLDAFRRRRRSLLAAYVSPSAAALACQGGEADGTEQVTLRADRLGDPSELGAVLRRQLSSFGLRQADVRLILAPDFYKLLLVETPAVPEAEVNEALRWQLQDGAEFDMADAAIDSFPLPPAAARGTPMSFAVAAPNAELRRLVHVAEGAGLRIGAVDVLELSLRNLIFRLFDSPDQALGVLRLTTSGGVFSLSRGDQLFLARRLNGVPAEQDGEAWTGFRERLLVQIQRSVDYYESTLGQPPASGLFVAATDDREADIIRFLRDMLPFPVRSLPAELCRLLDLELHNPQPALLDTDTLTEVDRKAVAAALPALGGVFPVLAGESA
ncbi:MAG: hypothetical protein AAGG11_21045 [Pseudomonadota bacterium]